RRTTYGGKRPDRVVPVIYLLHPEYREVVSKAVVAEMVAERPFRQQLFRGHRSGDAEIGFGGDRQLSASADHGEAMPAQQPGKGELGHPLGEWHDRGNGQGGGAADKDVHPERQTLRDCLGMMDADAAVDLVVYSGLPIRFIRVPGDLDPVHPEIRTFEAG